MSEPNPAEPDASKTEEQTLPDAHRDIEFGNKYRLEYIKHLISITTGVLVFTITFMNDFVRKPSHEAGAKAFLLVGWSALIASMVAGILHMRYWALYYISWGTNWKEQSAREWRVVVNRRRIVAERVQLVGFAVGVVCLLIFAVWNMYTPSPNESKKPDQAQERPNQVLQQTAHAIGGLS